MNAYKTYAQIDAGGRLVLEGLPFRDGALLEVLIIDPTQEPRERSEGWRALMRHVQALPHSKALSDEEIAAEIDAHRSGH
jgi:hypothetical protein